MVATVRGVSDWLRAKSSWLLAVLVMAGTVQLACAQETHETPQQKNEKVQELAALANQQSMDAVVGSGDLLHIDVFDVPELSRDVRVSDTGDISYPLIPGKITAAGLTSFQLESKLEQLLLANGLVSHPQVSVFVKEQNSQPVTVVGAVAHPMVYQVMRPTTLLEILTAAGGVSDDAGNIVIVTRPEHPDNVGREEPTSATTKPELKEQRITIPLQSLLESGNAVFNIQIYGGDTVTVPRAGIIYVLGSGVGQPGEYVLQNRGEQVTALKALALARGLTTFAKANSAVIMRLNPQTGQRDTIPVQLKKIEDRKADDVPMKSDDILYVPDSTGKKALARGTEAALGLGTAITVYRVQ